jgi:carboxymethylenebutenolidase
MREAQARIYTADGAMPVFVVAHDDPAAVIVMLMDGRGIREALRDQARKLAGAGYYVLLPNFFYRPAGDGPTEDIEDMARITELNALLTPARAATDVGACLAFTDADPAAPKGPAGLIGYCMGGRLSVVAAQALGDRIGAVASLHPGYMATRSEASPHRHLDRIAAPIYFGLPETDPHLSPGAVERLREALDANGIEYEIEILPGCTHGYSVPGNEDYHREAAERAWAKSLALFGDRLGRRAEA